MHTCAHAYLCTSALQLRSACVTWLQTGATPADLAEAQGHTEVADLIRRTTVPSAPSLPTAARRHVTEHMQQAPHQVPSSSSQNAASAVVRQRLPQRGTDHQSASASFDSHTPQPSAPSLGFVSYPTVYSGDAHRAAEGAATSTDGREPADATSSSSVIWQASTAVLGTVKVPCSCVTPGCARLAAVMTLRSRHLLLHLHAQQPLQCLSCCTINDHASCKVALRCVASVCRPTGPPRHLFFKGFRTAFIIL